MFDKIGSPDMMIGLAVGQLENYMASQEKDHKAEVIWFIANDYKVEPTELVVDMWAMSQKENRRFDGWKLRELIGYDGKIFDSIPAFYKPLLKGIDLSEIGTFFDLITGHITDMETTRKGRVSFLLSLKKEKKLLSTSKEILVKLLLHRVGKEDYVIENTTLKQFIENVIESYKSKSQTR